MVKASLLIASVAGQELFLESAVSKTQNVAHQKLHSMLKASGRYSDEEVSRLANIMKQRDHLVSPADDSNLEYNDAVPFKTTDKWIVQHKGYSSERGFVSETVTYSSPVIKLKPGEAHFTINDLYHVPMPKGDYVLLKNNYDMYTEDGTEKVPLNQVYPHHWLVGGGSPLDECDQDYFWGGGAEFHGMSYQVPEGYGFKRLSSKGWCGGNFHLINTQNLSLKWDGMNDPSQFPSPYGAALKNCIECGWAPGRAIECTEGGDGGFECCFTKSRCPVENKKLFDKSQSFRFTYDLEITRDLNAVKALKMVLLDVGCTEWNIAPNMKDKCHTHCDDKVCKSYKEWTVGDWNHKFGDGICPGTMKWSYLHQHVGAINGTFTINGKDHCTGYPVVGTDPNYTYGNELGYVTQFTECVNSTNEVRLNAGDKVAVTSLYDVDSQSTRNFPIPEGKHGGIMGLFFGHMICDPGSFGEIYICRDSGCIPTYDGKQQKGEKTWGTLEDCQAECA